MKLTQKLVVVVLNTHMNFRETCSKFPYVYYTRMLRDHSSHNVRSRVADFRTENFNSCFPRETPIYL